MALVSFLALLRHSFKLRTSAAGLLLGAVVVAAMPAHAVSPQCRFLGAWTSRVKTARAVTGAPLSPLQIAADPSVLHEGGAYRMWFTNANSAGRTGVAYAESPDGRSWTVWKNVVHPDLLMDLVLTAPDGAWDAPGIETPNVIHLSTGGYRLYYSGNHLPQGSVTYAIGMAESSDGLHWTRRSTPVLEAKLDWEKPECANASDQNTCHNGGVLEPSVLYDPSVRLFKMWYVGLGVAKDSFRTYRIGYATSPDGINWTRRPTPVFTFGRTGAWDAMWTSQVEVFADPKAGYHMLYFGSAPADYRDGVEIQRGSIGHAYSADGITWERDPANPVLKTRHGQGDAWSVGGPSAMIEKGILRLWYFGNPASGLRSDIFTVETPCNR